MFDLDDEKRAKRETIELDIVNDPVSPSVNEKRIYHHKHFATYSILIRMYLYVYICIYTLTYEVKK